MSAYVSPCYPCKYNSYTVDPIDGDCLSDECFRQEGDVCWLEEWQKETELRKIIKHHRRKRTVKYFCKKMSSKIAKYVPIEDVCHNCGKYGYVLYDLTDNTKYIGCAYCNYYEPIESEVIF